MIALFFHNRPRLFFMKTMVYSREEKAIVKNSFIEKEWATYHICKEHQTNNRDKFYLQRLLISFKMLGSMNKRPGSGRSRIATSEENKER